MSSDESPQSDHNTEDEPVSIPSTSTTSTSSTMLDSLRMARNSGNPLEQLENTVGDDTLEMLVWSLDLQYFTPPGEEPQALLSIPASEGGVNIPNIDALLAAEQTCPTGDPPQQHQHHQQQQQQQQPQQLMMSQKRKSEDDSQFGGKRRMLQRDLDTGSQQYSEQAQLVAVTSQDLGANIRSVTSVSTAEAGMSVSSHTAERQRYPRLPSISHSQAQLPAAGGSGKLEEVSALSLAAGDCEKRDCSEGMSPHTAHTFGTICKSEAQRLLGSFNPAAISTSDVNPYSPRTTSTRVKSEVNTLTPPSSYFTPGFGPVGPSVPPTHWNPRITATHVKSEIDPPSSHPTPDPFSPGMPDPHSASDINPLVPRASAPQVKTEIHPLDPRRPSSRLTPELHPSIPGAPSGGWHSGAEWANHRCPPQPVPRPPHPPIEKGISHGPYQTQHVLGQQNVLHTTSLRSGPTAGQPGPSMGQPRPSFPHPSSSHPELSVVHPGPSPGQPGLAMSPSHLARPLVYPSQPHMGHTEISPSPQHELGAQVHPGSQRAETAQRQYSPVPGRFTTYSPEADLVQQLPQPHQQQKQRPSSRGQSVQQGGAGSTCLLLNETQGSDAGTRTESPMAHGVGGKRTDSVSSTTTEAQDSDDRADDKDTHEALPGINPESQNSLLAMLTAWPAGDSGTQRVSQLLYFLIGRYCYYSTEGACAVRLYRFLLDELEQPEPQDDQRRALQWMDRSRGVFRVLDKAEVARRWGTAKNNASMTYEKFSRSLRYYYKVKQLERVPGHHLVFRFLENAHPEVWETIEPSRAQLRHRRPQCQGIADSADAQKTEHSAQTCTPQTTSITVTSSVTASFSTQSSTMYRSGSSNLPLPTPVCQSGQRPSQGFPGYVSSASPAASMVRVCSRVMASSAVSPEAACKSSQRSYQRVSTGTPSMTVQPPALTTSGTHLASPVASTSLEPSAQRTSRGTFMDKPEYFTQRAAQTSPVTQTSATASATGGRAPGPESSRQTNKVTTSAIATFPKDTDPQEDLSFFGSELQYLSAPSTHTEQLDSKCFDPLGLLETEADNPQESRQRDPLQVPELKKSAANTPDLLQSVARPQVAPADFRRSMSEDVHRQPAEMSMFSAMASPDRPASASTLPRQVSGHSMHAPVTACGAHRAPHSVTRAGIQSNPSAAILPRPKSATSLPRTHTQTPVLRGHSSHHASPTVATPPVTAPTSAHLPWATAVDYAGFSRLADSLKSSEERSLSSPPHSRIITSFANTGTRLPRHQQAIFQTAPSGSGLSHSSAIQTQIHQTQTQTPCLLPSTTVSAESAHSRPDPQPPGDAESNILARLLDESDDVSTHQQIPKN